MIPPSLLLQSQFFPNRKPEKQSKIRSNQTLEMDSSHNLQIFVQSPDLQIPSRSLIINRNQSLHHLKLSLFPKSTPQTLNSIYFTSNGNPLLDSDTLSLVPQLSSLILRIRALGGGGDGGATGAESRDCYLNMYAVKKPDKVDPNETRLSKWTTCSLSYEPLKAPCVIDRLGNVFNKEALVEALLGKKLPKGFGYIRGLRDMISIQLEEIPGGGEDEEVRFQCPITGLEFNGKYKFFALRSCGHVLSAKALKEVKSSACLVCHKEFLEGDKIVINGSEEEVAVLREKMEAEKAKVRDKKMKKGGVGVVEDGGLEGMPSSRLSGTKHGVEEKVGENGIVKVEGNGDGGVKGVQNGGVKKLKSGVVAPPNATKSVYESIFISSRKSEFKETYSCRSLPLGRN